VDGQVIGGVGGLDQIGSDFKGLGRGSGRVSDKWLKIVDLWNL
jgi:hypothetical protein